MNFECKINKCVDTYIIEFFSIYIDPYFFQLNKIPCGKKSMFFFNIRFSRTTYLKEIQFTRKRFRSRLMNDFPCRTRKKEKYFLEFRQYFEFFFSEQKSRVVNLKIIGVSPSNNFIFAIFLYEYSCLKLRLSHQSDSTTVQFGSI